MLELVIDSFAGGGGASEGIKAALGRDPDIAVNHDPMALAMHRMNHPGTRHLVQDVLVVDSVSMCAGQPIGMLWMSPDCTDHSKAKGGPPRRGADSTRGLAWAIVGWVKALPKWQRPRVIFLENVEEFAHWGPLSEDGKRCPVQKGATFKAFVQAWRDLGYPAIEWRERRAWKAGAPTIRKRLYMIIRRDGEPIVWPEAAFGNPGDPADAARIAKGELMPWRTAASHVIDFSLPCPSIFDTSAEIKAKLGIRAIRPLADKTMARVAKGVMRYVVNAPRPFLVKVNHTGRDDDRSVGLERPLATLTGHRDDALVMPVITHAQQGGRNRQADAPLHTICASEKDQNAVVMPFVTKFNSGSTGHAAEEPLHTVTSHTSETHGGGAAPLGLVSAVLVGCGGRAGQTEPQPGEAPVLTQTGKPDLCVVSPVLMPRLQEKAGHEPRGRRADLPTATVMASDSIPGHLVAPVLVPRYGEREGQAPRALHADQPLPTVVPDGNGASLAAVHLQRQFGASIGGPADEPSGTVTAGGAGKTAVVAAFLAQHNGGWNGRTGHQATEPLSTLSTSGAQQQLVAASMVNLRGSDRRDAPADEPLRTLSAGGTHAAAVYAFLIKYFGNEVDGHDLDAPIGTQTQRDRNGLVTVTVDGESYVIVDIGMRMLTPRERFNAQGFRPDYIIDRGILEDGSTVFFTMEQQGRMCGNSVCPAEAEALVRANYRPRDVMAPVNRKPPLAMPLFMEAAE